MTEDEQFSVVGKVVVGEQENSKRLSLLRIRIREIGEGYLALGRALINNAELVGFRGESIESRFNVPQRRVPESSLFDESSLRALLSEYRSALVRQEELEEELRNLGVRSRPIEIRRPA